MAMNKYANHQISHAQDIDLRSALVKIRKFLIQNVLTPERLFLSINPQRHRTIPLSQLMDYLPQVIHDMSPQEALILANEMDVMDGTKHGSISFLDFEMFFNNHTKKMVASEFLDDHPVFPKWLVSRTDFKNQFTFLGESNHLTLQVVEAAVRLPPKERKLPDLNVIADWLRQNDILKHIHRSGLIEICKTMHCFSVPANNVICSQGDPGDSFYVIVSGVVDIYVDGNLVTTLTQGNSFGDKSLETDGPRTATAKTNKPCQLLVLLARDYRSYVASVSAGVPKDLMELLKGSRAFKFYDGEELFEMSRLVNSLKHRNNDKIVWQGEASNNLYIVLSGKVRITRKVNTDMLMESTKRSLNTAVPNTVSQYDFSEYMKGPAHRTAPPGAFDEPSPAAVGDSAKASSSLASRSLDTQRHHQSRNPNPNPNPPSSKKLRDVGTAAFPQSRSSLKETETSPLAGKHSGNSSGASSAATSRWGSESNVASVKVSPAASQQDIASSIAGAARDDGHSPGGVKLVKSGSEALRYDGSSQSIDQSAAQSHNASACSTPIRDESKDTVSDLPAPLLGKGLNAGASARGIGTGLGDGSLPALHGHTRAGTNLSTKDLSRGSNALRSAKGTSAAPSSSRSSGAVLYSKGMSLPRRGSVKMSSKALLQPAMESINRHGGLVHGASLGVIGGDFPSSNGASRVSLHGHGSSGTGASREHADSNLSIVVKVLSAGDVFGDECLRGIPKYLYTASSVGQSQVCHMKKSHAQYFLRDECTNAREAYEKFLEETAPLHRSDLDLILDNEDSIRKHAEAARRRRQLHDEQAQRFANLSFDTSTRSSKAPSQRGLGLGQEVSGKDHHAVDSIGALAHRVSTLAYTSTQFLESGRARAEDSSPSAVKSELSTESADSVGTATSTIRTKADLKASRIERHYNGGRRRTRQSQKDGAAGLEALRTMLAKAKEDENTSILETIVFEAEDEGYDTEDFQADQTARDEANFIGRKSNRLNNFLRKRRSFEDMEGPDSPGSLTKAKSQQRGALALALNPLPSPAQRTHRSSPRKSFGRGGGRGGGGSTQGSSARSRSPSKSTARTSARSPSHSLSQSQSQSQCQEGSGGGSPGGRTIRFNSYESIAYSSTGSFDSAADPSRSTSFDIVDAAATKRSVGGPNSGRGEDRAAHGISMRISSEISGPKWSTVKDKFNNSVPVMSPRGAGASVGIAVAGAGGAGGADSARTQPQLAALGSVGKSPSQHLNS